MDLDKLRNSHQRREIMWTEERQKLEKEMNELREKISKGSTEGRGDLLDTEAPKIMPFFRR